MAHPSTRQDIYTRVTTRILAELEKGVRPWIKPWSVEHAIPFMKPYTVFNVEQIEGLPAHFYAQPVNPLPLSDRIAHADRFVTATGAAIHHAGNQAFYAPSRDTIQLPPFEAFKDKESYYSTALHELTH